MFRTRLNDIKNSFPKTQRAVELASEKGASNWLTVIPIDEMGFTLNKGEFRDALKLTYDWEIAHKPSICVCGDVLNVDHAMVCRRGGFIIHCHNELRDLEADMLSMVCNLSRVLWLRMQVSEVTWGGVVTGSKRGHGWNTNKRSSRTFKQRVLTSGA